MKIAIFADEICPDDPSRAVALAAHFAAATPNSLILEYVMDDVASRCDLLVEPLKYVDGHVDLPDAPGLGIKLNEKAFAGKGMQPWRLRLMMAPDGNVMYQ